MTEPVLEYSFTPHAQPSADYRGPPHEQDRGVLGVIGMKLAYDEATDTLTLILIEAVEIAESDEDKPGVILDYDASRNLVSLEVIDASKRVTEARKIEFQIISS